MENVIRLEMKRNEELVPNNYKMRRELRLNNCFHASNTHIHRNITIQWVILIVVIWVAPLKAIVYRNRNLNFKTS